MAEVGRCGRMGINGISAQSAEPWAQREEETSTQNWPISMARVLEDESSPHLGCSMGRALDRGNRAG